MDFFQPLSRLFPRLFALVATMLLPCLLTSTIVACSVDDDADDNAIVKKMMQQDAPADNSDCYFRNNPLPYGKGRLRVLAVGNSYTIDGITYLPKILKDAGVGDSKYSLYYVVSSGASLQYWYERLLSGETVSPLFAGGTPMPVHDGEFSELLSADWDVIVFQQYSGAATNYDTFNPHLRGLIDGVLGHCTNPDVALAWQLAWSYADGFSDRLNNVSRWEKICVAASRMVVYDGIDIIIPTGTAIQNARNTELNGEGQLTRDGTHLDIGVGRYIAACAWAQTLFAPLFVFSVDTLPTVTSLPESELSAYPYPQQQVTAQNRALCQKSAVMAVESPFEVADGSPITGIRDIRP